ncbi:MAG TPA: hypothetical protein VKY65_10065 [Alphaproteobacteria bacterium]|nr:hypothetical protein [Alphaproteobacteria bacterium]
MRDCKQVAFAIAAMSILLFCGQAAEAGGPAAGNHISNIKDVPVIPGGVISIRSSGDPVEIARLRQADQQTVFRGAVNIAGMEVGGGLEIRDGIVEIVPAADGDVAAATHGLHAENNPAVEMVADRAHAREAKAQGASSVGDER